MPRLSPDPKLEQFWRRHLSRQPASGLTIRDYCCQHALREPSFYAWRRIITERDRRHPPTPPQPPTTPAFLPVTIVEPQSHHPTTPIDILLANGSRVRVRSGCDRSLLADVLALLHASPKQEARTC